MSVSTPHSARDTWGKEMTEDISQWVRQIARDEAVSRDEYREVLSRLDSADHGMEGLSERMGRLEDGQQALRREMNERFDTINGRFDQVQQQFDGRFDAMNGRFDQMQQQFDQRLDSMGAQFDQRLDKMNERFDRMNERFDRMNEQMRIQTRWTIGTIALIGIILSTLLAIAEFAA